MTQTIATAVKRLHIGRILLLLVLVVVLLLAGFFLRSFVPFSWLQSLRIGSIGLPGWVAQAPEASPTALAGVVNRSESTEFPAVMALPSSSPTATATVKAVGAGPGVVTVLTLTPTLEVRATEPGPTAVTTLATPAMENQLPTGTPLPETPAAPGEQLPGIPNELRSLNRLITVSRILLLTFSEGQPEGEERAILEAQLGLVILRMEKLEARLMKDEAASELFGTSTTVSSAQVAEIFATMRETVGLLRGELTEPEAAGPAMINIEARLGTIQEIVQQLRVIAGPVEDESTSQSSPAPAPTNTPTPLSTPTIQTDASVDQLLAMMDEMLRQIQAMMPPAGSKP